MPNSFERSKMRAVCRHLADALNCCSGSVLQQRWNDFEKRFWPKWKAGINRRGGTCWTWDARVLISARMIVPSLDMLANVRVNQWIAHLPEDHPLAQQHRALLSATAPITWTSSFNRHLAVCNGLRLLFARGYDSLHYIKDDDLKLLSARWSKGTDALDAALCSVGVFSRTPKRGSALGQLALLANLACDMNGRGRRQPQRRAGTDAALPHLDHDGHLCTVRAGVTAARTRQDVRYGRVPHVKAYCGKHRKYFHAAAIADGELAS
jgi:hypothetical protein